MHKINFKNVSTEGLESSPIKEQLAGLRANEARYYWNKYHHEFSVEDITEPNATLNWIQKILLERDMKFDYIPLETSEFIVDGIKMAYVFYQNGLVVNVMYSIENDKKRAVGFKLSDGMDIPKEFEGKFKFARQKSKLAGIIRGSFFIIKNNYLI